MVLVLITEDGIEIPFDGGDRVSSVIYAIHKNEIATIFVGETGKNGWDKQYEDVTVKPTKFVRR